MTRDELPEVMAPIHVKSFLGIGKKQTYEMMENPPFRTVRVSRLHKISKVAFFDWFDKGVKVDE
ncbi:DNA-binding protein [Rossellomorea marisflavi]|uniref:DNA-binding protein n=1 Tax=Rossellomorea marisflavi TaxID=189381 RepID=A0A5D4RSL4_9BACI|nr:DNA-binding protein [Rossellomorea marisflavi]TYS53759.1 DNA-binding protein [Rossellomorea marisflavi]WJV17001.1 DNA-binding protein [Rossellomorea marisflavi]